MQKKKYLTTPLREKHAARRLPIDQRLNLPTNMGKALSYSAYAVFLNMYNT